MVLACNSASTLMAYDVVNIRLDVWLYYAAKLLYDCFSGMS
jgi:hypothetical protein